MYKRILSTIVIILLLSVSSFSFAAFSLKKIKLPPGFHISVYAQNVVDARQMALGEKGVVFAGTRKKGKIYALLPNQSGTKAKQILMITTDLDSPNGVATRGKDLYVAGIQKIFRYPNITEHLKKLPKPEMIIDTLPDERHHGYHYIKFSPDGWLYISIGMPCNTCSFRKTKPLLGTIVRIKPDGHDLQIFSKGIRNSVGFAWQPKTNVLWFTDNGQDWMGKNLPPDEINRAPKRGMDFGFPYFYGNNIPTPDYKDAHISKVGMTPPAWELQAHVAPLGMTFYTGNAFPKKYQNQLFVAEHGSWNRLRKVGYQVVMITIHGVNPPNLKRFEKRIFQFTC